MQQAEQQQQQQWPPSKFWRHGRLHPIEFTFLCEYPYGDKKSYAIYLNQQTKEPERIYLPHIEAYNLDYNFVYQYCFKGAISSLEIILDSMNKKGIEIPKVKSGIFEVLFGKEEPPA